MAIDSITAKRIANVLISQIVDEEKRQRLIIGIVIGIVVFILLLAMPILLLVSGWDSIKQFFNWQTEEEMKEAREYASIYKLKEDYGINLEIGDLTFNGELPMPVNDAVVTCEFGTRIHPITRKEKFSYRN